MNTVRIIETIIFGVLSFASFLTFVYLVVERGFGWQWIPVGIFTMFLTQGWLKVNAPGLNTPPDKKE